MSVQDDRVRQTSGSDLGLLRVERLSKTFPGTRALDEVSLEVAAGEVHALVGQNGSGKSTLIKILAGYHRADPGAAAWLDGEPFDLTDLAHARHHRLRFVHQDLGLVLELSATDNLALRGEFLRDRLGLVRWRAQARQARELLDRFGLDFDVDRPLAEATPVQRTLVAIAAALTGWEDGGGVLALDEPTAVLPPGDVERLLEIVERVRAQGTGILYVSHRLDEVFRVADRVTVLREGRVVGTRRAADLNAQSLAELMVGADVDAGYRAGLAPDPAAPTVLEARDVRARYVAGVDLDLRSGEILGLAGLPGSGREELPYCLAGAADAEGRIRLEGGPWHLLRHASRLGIAIVPADRGREGVIQGFAVAENLSVSILRGFRRFGWLHGGLERRSAEEWMRAVGIKAPSADAPITTLSGGNQQKAVIARCLARRPRVLVLCEPTAGVDVGARQAIYELVAERAGQGLSLVVSSSDTGDLLALCTRVLVMGDGRIVRELSDAEITEKALLSAMEETDQR
jgi:ribose transport system ATP-binding protein